MKWHVQMSRLRREYLSFDIDATDIKEARRKAREHAEDNADDFCDGSIGRMYIKKLEKV